MTGRVLVAYASKYGSTAQIAQAIGQTLQTRDLRVDVIPVDYVYSVVRYDAVILGSAVYAGRWRKEAAHFLKQNELLLIDRPLWLFSSGPIGEGEPQELLNGWLLPAAQQAIVERIRPRDVVVFHGNLDPNTLNFVERWIVRRSKQPFGDYRDWKAIAAWATSIADALLHAELATA